MFLLVGSVDLNAEMSDLMGYEECLNIALSTALLRSGAERNDGESSLDSYNLMGHVLKMEESLVMRI